MYSLTLGTSFVDFSFIPWVKYWTSVQYNQIIIQPHSINAICAQLLSLLNFSLDVLQKEAILFKQRVNFHTIFNILFMYHCPSFVHLVLSDVIF